MNSNITILSNVYIRTHEDLRLDTEFTSRVRGQPALRALKEAHDDIVLTEWQENLRQNDTTCPLAENGEKTHGLVRRDGSLAWEGRCEFKECERFGSCTETARFQRDIEPLHQEIEMVSEPLEFEWLGKGNLQIIHSYVDKPDSETLLSSISIEDDIDISHQTSDLAEISQKLKHSLLNLPPQQANDIFAGEMAKIQDVGRLDLCKFDKFADNSAILCRSGGEAEYASHVLHRKRVAHALLRDAGTNRSLDRCIADCLWDYRSEMYISRDEFVQRFRQRVWDNLEAAASTFDALCKIAKSSETFDADERLDLSELANKLSDPIIKLPDELQNKCNHQLIVSTIHKAKGLKFDSVYLLGNDFTPNPDNTDEALCLFAAFTRAKSNVYKISPKKDLYVKSSETNSNRYIQLQKYKWTHPPAYYCLNMAIGLPSDFLEAGFVKGAFLDALKMQEYIAKNVNIGDSVEIKLVGGEYRVIHKKIAIGYMPQEITAEFQKIANECRPRSNAPPSLSKVYVSNIVTIASPKSPENVHEFFRNARFWLGVELTGFPKINWNTND